jgi:hypothetical protein
MNFNTASAVPGTIARPSASATSARKALALPLIVNPKRAVCASSDKPMMPRKA